MKAFYVVTCLTLFAIVMAAAYGLFHWLVYGISKEFGAGVGVGLFLGAGLMYMAGWMEKKGLA